MSIYEAGGDSGIVGYACTEERLPMPSCGDPQDRARMTPWRWRVHDHRSAGYGGQLGFLGEAFRACRDGMDRSRSTGFGKCPSFRVVGHYPFVIGVPRGEVAIDRNTVNTVRGREGTKAPPACPVADGRDLQVRPAGADPVPRYEATL